MKPEIIFISEKDGLIRISKEDIIALVDKAYSAGIADANHISTSPWIVQTDTTYGAEMRGDAE